MKTIKEESLSDKIENLFEIEYLGTMADVQGDVTILLKEAVKRLKEKLPNSNFNIPFTEEIKTVHEEIDKIFGDKILNWKLRIRELKKN